MNRPLNNDDISKARYYELKWYCRQYNEWKKQKTQINFFPGGNFRKNISESNKKVDMTVELAITLASLNQKIESIDKCIMEVAPEIGPWLKRCVTEGIGYENLYDIPCSKEYFYKRYKAFFSRINRFV